MAIVSVYSRLLLTVAVSTMALAAACLSEEGPSQPDLDRLADKLDRLRSDVKDLDEELGGLQDDLKGLEETFPVARPVPEPPASVPRSTPAATPTPVSALPSPVGILERSAAAMEAVDTYHFEMDMQMQVDSEGFRIAVPFTFVGDVRTPDRVHGYLSMTVFGETMESEVIAIGERAYEKDRFAGSWEESSDFLVSSFEPREFVAMEPGDIEALELVGEETLERVGVYHLRGLASPDLFEEGTTGDLQLDYWIDMESFLVWRIALEGEIRTEGEGDPFFGGDAEATATVVMTMTFSDFGKRVVIEAPLLRPEPTPTPFPTPPPPAAPPPPRPAPTPVQVVPWPQGAQVFLAKGCGACHTVRGLSGAVGAIGPDLSGIVRVATGRVAGLSAEGYIRQSIEDPAAFIVPGYPPLEPPLRGNMSDLEFENLVAFLLTLDGT